MTTTKKMPTPRGHRAGIKVILVADFTAAHPVLIAHPARHTCHTGQNGNHRKNAAVHHQRSAIIRIGAEYTKSEAASLPVSEAFPHPDFIGLGVGRAYPQGWPHRFGGVFKPHVHSSDLNNLRMVFEIPEGIKAMNHATAGQTAPTQNPDHHQTDLFFQASNHLSLALHSLRHATGDRAIKTAAGRANAAARALNQLAGGLSNA